MPRHAEQRVLPYTPDQMFDLVADVARYPEFLPWCVGARIRKQTPTELYCDLIIGFKVFRERFTSRVTLDREHRVIQVAYLDGPMRHLTNRWAFLETGDGHVEIDFFVEFEFRSALLRRAIGGLFHHAVQRMVRAFEARAAEIYGPPDAIGETA